MPGQARLDERSVVEMWERQAFDRSALSALGIRVVFRGLPSDAGGPDYQEAILALGDRGLSVGDVEFHVRSEDWYTHGHHTDSRYDGVILHVVWEQDSRPTFTSAGREVPILALERAAPTAVISPPTLTIHPCVAAFSRLDRVEVETRIQAAGTERFAMRAAVFASEAEAASPDQALYTALLEACGYASNRDSFRRLADVAPYAWIMSVPAEQRLATLLDAAGLGPATEITPPGHLVPDAWRLRRLRPANHPARRLAGVATLLDRLSPSIVETLCVRLEAAEGPAAMRALLTVEGPGEAFIGRGRADEMAASVVLPFIAGIGAGSGLRLYLDYPAPPHTRWTRLMESLLAQAGHPFRARRATQHQGLHWLYHSFCRREGGDACPVCGTPPDSE